MFSIFYEKIPILLVSLTQWFHTISTDCGATENAPETTVQEKFIEEEDCQQVNTNIKERCMFQQNVKCEASWYTQDVLETD